MSKSILTIQKEILKKEYEKSPLGIAEKKLRKFYDEAYLKDNPFPEEVLIKRDEIREENEKKVSDYVDLRLKIDKEAIDAILLESFNKEIELLENDKANRTSN